MAIRSARAYLLWAKCSQVQAGPNGGTKYPSCAAFFRLPELRLLEFKLSTAEMFAEIRGRAGISSGDAIHLACAAEARVDLFLTHDKRLARKIVSGIQFIATPDTNIL